jgi:hypothetical protein
VNVESDIVNSIHGVLLIEISESAAANSRSQQCNLEENPFSLGSNPFFQHLYIQTDGSTPITSDHLKLAIVAVVTAPSVPSMHVWDAEPLLRAGVAA